MKDRQRTARYMWDDSGLNIVIPKRRGDGYLLVPYGHHNNPKLNTISDSVNVADVTGLDGYLNFRFSSKVIYDVSKRAEIVEIVMPQLAAYFDFKFWAEDSGEFWRVIDNQHKKKGHT